MAPEALMAMAVPVILGWMGFTWRRAENALEKAERVADKVDKVELKMAENFVTKQDFNQSMDRLFGVLGEMKSGMQYLTERVDYHVTEQANETTALRGKNQDLQTQLDFFRSDRH